MMIIPNFYLDTKINLELYNDKYFQKFLNEVNTKTCDVYARLANDYKTSDCFQIPYCDRQTEWGNERIFMPISDKLFKIVECSKNDTSVQLHPMKTETWYSLNDLEIYNGYDKVSVTKNSKIVIPEHSIHSLTKYGRVFEVQDNNIFDEKETVRIYDNCGRAVQPKDFYKYTLPKYKNKFYIDKENISQINNNMDLFLYVLDGYVEIIVNNVKKVFTSDDMLVFIKGGKYKVNKQEGVTIYENAVYYRY